MRGLQTAMLGAVIQNHKISYANN